jgi:hypothetical protein
VINPDANGCVIAAIQPGLATFQVDQSVPRVTYRYVTDVGSRARSVQLDRNVPEGVVSTVPAVQRGSLRRSNLNGNDLSRSSNIPSGSSKNEQALESMSLQRRLGGKILFDPHLGVSFLADANLPATRPLGVAGIKPDGTMTWPSARAWIEALNACKYLGYADWRLPMVVPLNGADIRDADPKDPSTPYDGSRDIGFNVGAPNTEYYGKAKSELPHIFYFELHNRAAKDILGEKRKLHDFNSGPFVNLMEGYYWTSREFYGGGRFAFDFDSGAQYAFVPEFGYRVLPVRTGDIARHVEVDVDRCSDQESTNR